MAEIIGYEYEAEITETIFGSNLEDFLNDENVVEYHMIDTLGDDSEDSEDSEESEEPEEP